MTEYAEARKVAELLAAISEPTRLLVLWELAKGPMHVGAISDAVGVKMVNMSHHLGVMRQSGVLDDEKEGRKVVYKLNPEVFTPGTTPDILGTLTLGQFRVVLRAKKEPPPVTTNAKTRKKNA